MKAFCDTLQNGTQLEQIKFSSIRPDTELFRQHIEFYTAKKLAHHRKGKKYVKRQEALNNDKMFESVLNMIEQDEKKDKMPVRKFFNNTFGTLLNDAIFALKKKQQKNEHDSFLFTKKGSAKFVAMYLLENLPAHEKEADFYDPNDDADEF